MIERILEKGHKAIMNRTQEIVNSWNWITGSDKYTLANTIIGLSTIPILLYYKN